MKKLASRKFVVPTSASLLALVNDAGALGFDWKTMMIVVGSSLIYAAIQCWYDVAKLKYPGKASP